MIGARSTAVVLRREPQGATIASSRFRAVEIVVAAIVFLILWCALAWIVYLANIRGALADSAFVGQIFYNFNAQPAMRSSLVSSILESMKTIWWRPAEFVCGQPLVFQEPQTPLTFHLYLIGYLLLPIARLLPWDVLIAVVHGFIYAAVPLFTYAFARLVKVSVISAVLLTLLVLQHPLWQEGVLGQFYFNRLFLPVCALLLWLLWQEKRHVKAVVVVTLLAAATAEIYGLVLAALLVGVGVLQRRGWTHLLPLAMFCALYSVGGIALTQVLGGSSSTQDGVVASAVSANFASVLESRLQALLMPGTRVFLEINLLELGVLGLLSRGHFLLATLLTAPNLLVSIGGAEKTGWSTHYHVAYWLPLISAAVLGAGLVQARVAKALPIVLVAMIAISTTLDPVTGNVHAPTLPAPAALVEKLVYYTRNAPAEFAYREELRAAIRPGASVSAPEPAFFNLVDHPLYYYPLNVDTADNVIFRFDGSAQGVARFHSINYGQQDDRLDSCIIARMQQHGYDFSSARMVGNWAIVGRSP